MKNKKIKRITLVELTVFCLMALCSGFVIGIGAVASLLSVYYFGNWGRLIGACLFSFGIFSIVTYEMKLFTGMVADIPTLGAKNYWKLPVCFAFNSIGVAIIAVIAYYSALSPMIVPQGAALIESKLSAQGWVLKDFCSAVMCGALITLSVKAPKYSPQKGLSATVGVMFPIIVFAFCGFDHSVANMMYFYYFGEFSWRVIAYIVVTVLGNIVGGVTLPTITLLKERALRHEQTRNTWMSENGSEDY